MTNNTDKKQPTNDEKTIAHREKGHMRVVAPLVGVLFIMGGIVFYSPELYNMFCLATGYGGTTQRAEVNSGEVLAQKITVRFDATVAKDLDWEFVPVKSKIRAHIGETVLVNYKARNRSTKPTFGTAVYNVTPEIAGSFFNKIECFCFTEQRLEPGEEVIMPVSFFIDPEMVKDKSGRTVNEITLSYVFYAKRQAIKSAGLKAGDESKRF